MGRMVRLTASDGHEFGAYVAEPTGTRKAGLVVVQEIFGVNAHMREVCDRFAADGYEAVAPALFDRQEPGFESGYSPDEVERARRFIANPDFDAYLRDVAAARDHLAPRGRVGIVGYCLGGSVAYAAAARLDGLAAAVGYYGGRIAAMADEAPRCPTLLHFGDQDHSIPIADVEEIARKRPEVEIHVYQAGHGFGCDHRAAYDAAAATLAGERTAGFLAAHLAE